MFTKSRLTAIALISFAATTAMATTNANAFHERVTTCDILFVAGCGPLFLTEAPAPAGPIVCRLPATRPRPT